ncbi:hypothetical protein Trydic_g23685 [Trypoxylus dichotomus]
MFGIRLKIRIDKVKARLIWHRKSRVKYRFMKLIASDLQSGRALRIAEPSSEILKRRYPASSFHSLDCIDFPL